MLPFAIKTASSHSPAPSPPSPDKALSAARFGSNAALHRAQLQEAGLTPEIAALLPEPAAIVEILSDVATHRNASADSSENILSLMASMLQRYVRCNHALSQHARPPPVPPFLSLAPSTRARRSVRHAVASNFLRVWAHFLSREVRVASCAAARIKRLFLLLFSLVLPRTPATTLLIYQPIAS
jgi:hypothetical protein